MEELEKEHCERTPLLSTSPKSRRGSSASSDGTTSSSDIGSGKTSSSSDSKESGSLLGSLTRTQKATLAICAASDLLAYLSISIMAPFFPEEALAKGVSDTLSGWIFGTAPLVQFLMSPVCGRLVPIAGTRFVFLAGLFLCGGCTALFGLLAYVPVDTGIGTFVGLAFLLQIFKSLGTTAISTAAFVLIAKQFPDNCATAFGISEVFVGLGLVAGPGIGGLLYGVDGFYVPFVVIGGICLLSLPIVWWALPAQPEFKASIDAPRLTLSQVLFTRVGAVTSLAIVVSTYSWSILDPTLEPHLRQFNLSPELVGVIFLVMAAVYSICSPVWGWLADKLTDQRGLLIVGFIFAALGSVLIGPSPILGFDDSYGELWLVIVALIVLGVSASLSSIPTFNVYFTVVEKLGFEDDTRIYGIVAGLWVSMYSLGDFLGPSLGGLLLDRVGFNSMCSYTAGICLLMAMLLLLSWVWELPWSRFWDQLKPLDNQTIQDSEASMHIPA